MLYNVTMFVKGLLMYSPLYFQKQLFYMRLLTSFEVFREHKLK